MAVRSAVPAPSSSGLTPGRAVALWAFYVVVFNLAGGVAAGVLGVVFHFVLGGLSDVLYAAIYAVTGFMAYRLARNVREGR